MKIRSGAVAALVLCLGMVAAPAHADTGLPAGWKCQAKTTASAGAVLDCRGTVKVRAGKNPSRSQWAKNVAMKTITDQAAAAGLTMKVPPFPGCTWVKKDRWTCSAFWYVADPAAA